jgi:hypothetical protein
MFQSVIFHFFATMTDQTPPTSIINNDDINVESNETNRTNVIINNLFNQNYTQKQQQSEVKDDSSSESTRGKFLDEILTLITLIA